MCITESLCYTAEIVTTLQINRTSVRKMYAQRAAVFSNLDLGRGKDESVEHTKGIFRPRHYSV